MSLTIAVGSEIDIAIGVVKTLILLTGGIITYYAFKAYRRTNLRSLGALTLGFGLVTLGVLLAGLLSELLGVPLGIGILVESVLTLLGFLVIAYSLYVQ